VQMALPQVISKQGGLPHIIRKYIVGCYPYKVHYI
jgi:hypothetical protein